MKSEYFPYFKDKVAAITGSSSGIGLGYAEYVLAAGAKAVFMCARGKERLDQAGSELAERYPGKVFWKVVDVTEQKQVEAFVDDAYSKHGQLDLMFNNAGIAYMDSIWRVDDQLWQDLFNTNFWSMKYGTFAALKYMMKQNTISHIINTASISGVIPYPYQTAYCASKFAAVGFSRSLRYELSDENVKISCVCPPLVDTASVRKNTHVLPPFIMSVEDAVDHIAQGIVENRDLIWFPDTERIRNLLDCVLETDGILLENAKKRHQNMRDHGTPHDM